MLTDRFSRIHDYLRISLTETCNLRCSYCMPEEFPQTSFHQSKRMTADEIKQLAEIFIELGVKKIRLTGGEPLVRKDARQIIQQLSGFTDYEKNHDPVRLAITTNGIFVHDFIDDFKKANIRSVNVSLDTLIPERFEKITKRDYFHRVVSNIHLLLQNHFHVKVNVVVMNGVNDDELVDFVQMTRDFPLHIRFIEFMPFDGNQWKKEKVFSYREMLERIGSFYEVVPIENEKHDTAKKFKVLGFEGTFAVISTMSAPFCSDCNRLRLTADGKMKNCLFSKEETDLLSPLRRGEDVKQLIIGCLQRKHASLGGQFSPTDLPSESHPVENRSMIAIGG
ncbi:MAG: GTP 3',8-cyclase MoaA [Bacteroidetes bacterium]|nr:GTP 3',8-cyclase MoaA [Bacteroidota bacterium]